jgi:hypothetical protein
MPEGVSIGPATLVVGARARGQLTELVAGLKVTTNMVEVR